MTDNIIEQVHAEHLMAAFAVVLTHPAGFGIQLRANLWISRLEDGRFCVAQETDGSQTEEIFDDVRSAIDYYLDLRDNLKMGLDYQRDLET